MASSLSQWGHAATWNFEVIRLHVNWPLQIMLSNHWQLKYSNRWSLASTPFSRFQFRVSFVCLPHLDVDRWPQWKGKHYPSGPILPEVLATANWRTHSTIHMKRVGEWKIWCGFFFWVSFCFRSFIFSLFSYAMTLFLGTSELFSSCTLSTLTLRSASVALFTAVVCIVQVQRSTFNVPLLNTICKPVRPTIYDLQVFSFTDVNLFFIITQS